MFRLKWKCIESGRFGEIDRRFTLHLLVGLAVVGLFLGRWVGVGDFYHSWARRSSRRLRISFPFIAAARIVRQFAVLEVFVAPAAVSVSTPVSTCAAASSSAFFARSTSASRPTPSLFSPITSIPLSSAHSVVIGAPLTPHALHFARRRPMVSLPLALLLFSLRLAVTDGRLQ